MKPNAKTKRKRSTSSVLRISGYDLRLVQLLDYDDFQGRRVLVINLTQARLSDANDQTILEGHVMIRVETPLSAGSLLIVNRLLMPFAGFFLMVVEGNYQVTGNFAEVVADTVFATDIQPVNNLKKKLRMAEIKLR